MAIDADTTVKVSGGVIATAIAWFLGILRADYKDFKKDVYNKFELLGDEISENALLAEKSYVSKDDMREMRTYLSKQFEGLHAMINTRRH